MKFKTKLLMPVIGLTSLAAITPALVSCGEISKPTGQEFSVTVINGSTEGVSLDVEKVKEGEALNATVRWENPLIDQWVIDAENSKCTMGDKEVKNAFSGKKVTINEVTGHVKLLIVLTYDPEAYFGITMENSEDSDLDASFTYQEWCTSGENYIADITWTSWDVFDYQYSWMVDLTAKDADGNDVSVTFQETAPNAAEIEIEGNYIKSDITLTAEIRQVGYDDKAVFGGDAIQIGNENKYVGLGMVKGSGDESRSTVYISSGGAFIPDQTNIEYSFNVGALQAAVSKGSIQWEDEGVIVISLLDDYSSEVTTDHTSSWINSISAKFRYNGTTPIAASIQTYDSRRYLVLQAPDGGWGANSNTYGTVTGAVQYMRTSFFDEGQDVYPVVWQYPTGE